MYYKYICQTWDTPYPYIIYPYGMSQLIGSAARAWPSYRGTSLGCGCGLLDGKPVRQCGNDVFLRSQHSIHCQIIA